MVLDLYLGFPVSVGVTKGDNLDPGPVSLYSQPFMYWRPTVCRPSDGMKMWKGCRSSPCHTWCNNTTPWGTPKVPWGVPVKEYSSHVFLLCSHAMITLTLLTPDVWGFPPHQTNVCDTSGVSYHPIQFWCFPRGVSIRAHRLRVQSHKVTPPYQMPIISPRLSPVLLISQL